MDCTSDESEVIRAVAGDSSISAQARLMFQVQNGLCWNGEPTDTDQEREMNPDTDYVRRTKSYSTIIKSLNINAFQETCPLPELIAPCLCVTYQTGRMTVLCDDKQLGDEEIDRVLGVFLSQHKPLSTLMLRNNSLTRVPRRIRCLSQSVTTIYLDRNLIEEVKEGSFNFIETLQVLDLSNNQIKKMEEGAIRGNIFQTI